MSNLIRKSLEEELFALRTLAPEAIEDLPEVFESAVMDSLTNILGEAEALALSKVMGKQTLADPVLLFPELEKFLRAGAPILSGAIEEEFRVKVHEIFTKALATYSSLNTQQVISLLAT